MSVHWASLKGERDRNEDCHNIVLKLDSKDCMFANVNYYGIYDGHGGKFVADYLSKNIYHFFVDKRVRYPLETSYVNNVYNTLQKALFDKHTKEATECGATCLVVCHYKDNKNENYLNIMNTGDSRCVLCRNNIAIPLTRDHKPDWPDEYNRIMKLGGTIKKDKDTYRINDLSVSRAFGDKESCKYVTHLPDIYKYKIINKDRFIIIACDGLWDVVSSQDAVNFILKNCYDSVMKRINPNINISNKLAEYAIAKGSGDNVTCVVVFFD
jgi:protein phosphatase 1L